MEKSMQIIRGVSHKGKITSRSEWDQEKDGN